MKFIHLVRENDNDVIINADHVCWAEPQGPNLPRTVLHFVNGDKVVVDKPIDETLLLLAAS